MSKYALQNADGLGWRFEQDGQGNGSISVLFEFKDGEDTHGIRLKISGGLKEVPTMEHIEALIEAVQKEGFNDGAIAGDQLTPITWATYLEEYGGD